MEENITDIFYTGRHYYTTKPMHQYSTNQCIRLQNFGTLEYPYKAHISNSRYGAAMTLLCNDDTIEIPDQYLQNGRDIFVWIYLSNAETDGDQNIIIIEIPVLVKSKADGDIYDYGDSHNTSDFARMVQELTTLYNQLSGLFEDGVLVLEGMTADERMEWENANG